MRGALGVARVRASQGNQGKDRGEHKLSAPRTYSTPPPHLSEGLLCSREPRPRARPEEMGLGPSSRLSGDSQYL